MDDKVGDGSGDELDDASPGSNPIRQAIIYRPFVLGFHPIFRSRWNEYLLGASKIAISTSQREPRSN